MTCTYTFTGPDGEKTVITGLPAFKAYLASGGLAALRGEPVAMSKRKPSIGALLRKYGEPVANTIDAMKRFGNGDRLFGFHEQEEGSPRPHEILNVTELDNWAPDQLMALSRFAGQEEPRFSLAKRQEQARTLVADLFQSKKSLNWWHRTVGTQYHKAQVDTLPGKNPGDVGTFGAVYNEAQAFLGDVSAFANEAADQAPTLLPQLNRIRDALKGFPRKADVEAIAAPIFEGTLIDEKVFEDGELRDRFKLNDKQIGMYREFRAAVDNSLDTVVAGDVARYLGKAPKEVRNIAARDPMLFRDAVLAWTAAQRKDARDALAAARREAKAVMDQFWKDKKKALDALDARPTERIVERDKWDAMQPKEQARADALLNEAQEVMDAAVKDDDTIKAKYARIDDLKKKGYAPLMRFGRFSVYVTDKDGGQVYFGMYDTERAANAAARDLKAEYPDATIEQGIMSQEAYKLFAGVSPETLELFGESAGLSQDDVFQSYLKLVKSNRSAMKRLIHRKGIEGFDKDVPRVLSSFILSNSRVASAGIHMGDLQSYAEAIPKGKGDVKDDAIKLAEYVQNPTEEAAKFRGLLFMQYLGGSVASAVVNMTQPVTMSYPYLSQFTNPAKAAATLANAIRSAATHTGIDAELASALKRAEQDGVVSPQEVHQLQAEAMRNLGANQLVRRATFLWGSFFSLAEQFNRRSTFIAAYRIARDQGMENPFGFAEKAVVETQGVYNRGNRPNWARGAIGSTVFTFKQFSVSYLEFLKRLPKREKALALAVLMLAAGLQGMPGADDLDDLIDTLGQQLGRDWNAKEAKTAFLTDVLGQGGADFVLRGFSAIPGFPLDVAGRMSVGNLIPGTGLLLKSKPDKSSEILEVVGPAGGLVRDAAKGQFLPVAVKNIAKAVDMMNHGMYRDEQGRRVTDADAWDALIKGVGFQPAEISRESRKIQIANQNVQLAKVVESQIVEKIAAGRFERDAEKVRDARLELIEWNRNNPRSPIVVKDSQIDRRVKEMRMSRSERFLKRTPAEMRGIVESGVR